ncbi:FAD-binding oxidoreductase [Chelativorans sp. Marseille-P2723]|uniref:FAD-binding oxidoreductase n=1 Tax=Chelativorans sp. Marseille-P2723 TaxID=2709133 RepID=UPI00156F7826|nr:FAD-binding oxidoreductase [Chelativorans sp. Marseille-P2723]
MVRVVQSFGRVAAATAHVISADEGLSLLKSAQAKPASLLPYGNGRSYGDTCQNTAGAVIDMRGRNRILDFDTRTGLIRAEAGAMLADIIVEAAPHGWFPPVVPGTRYVTLGGAIANDVHGKNHHRRGSFGCHVTALTLLRSDGIVYECAPDRETELFRATLGGMGLTGLIQEATIRLMRVDCADVIEKVQGFSSLDEYFDLAEEADAANEYAVAWIDQLAGGTAAGRGLLLTANHAPDGVFRPAGRARLSVPLQPPLNVLNKLSIRLFNAAYQRAKLRHEGPRRSHYGSYFFPLDGVAGWNRLYGPRGLHQHQSVIPEGAARTVVPALLAAARDAGEASFLTVLKRFGPQRSPAIMSFPRPGFTLTLDFPNRGKKTVQLLEQLDKITIDAGGAVNPYKDVRMSAGVFAASFPGWRILERQRDPAFISDFWRRTAMTLEPAPHGKGAAHDDCRTVTAMRKI